MSPRLTDWSLALAAVVGFITGLVSLISGLPQDWFIFALHAIAGFWLLILLWGKLGQVWPRLIHPRRWNRRTIFGVLALVLVILTLGSGIWWVGGSQWYFAGFNLLNWHIALGLILTAAIAIHMFARVKRLRKRDIVGRRRALYVGALLLGSIALWPAQQLSEHVLNLPSARQRFTGSYESGSYAGNAFPTSSWVADQPRPLDAQTWRLSLGGAITTPREFTYDELVAAGDGEHWRFLQHPALARHQYRAPAGACRCPCRCMLCEFHLSDELPLESTSGGSTHRSAGNPCRRGATLL